MGKRASNREICIRCRGPLDNGRRYCRKCEADIARDYRRKHPDAQRRWHAKSHGKRRMRVLIHYGGDPPKCSCCGEARKPFLVIDHINNDGAKHRREVGRNIVTWLCEHDFPSGFQVLCQNCNVGKELCGGVCPHETERRGGMVLESRASKNGRLASPP